jgi:MFS superfamily sulfate permease-like transporter
MAYAVLARLSPEYGLYTSFVGAALYWLFGTSKDIVIGVSNGYHPPQQTANDHRQLPLVHF